MTPPSPYPDGVEQIKKRNMTRKILILLLLITPLAPWRGVGGEVMAQAPGTTPVKVSLNTMMLHGRRYYVHIVEKGQTVYSIAKAYKVESYDAVTHVDIHFLHPGDTVWLPARGQFAEGVPVAQTEQSSSEEQASPTPTEQQPSQVKARPVRKVGKTVKVALMMPLHLNQIDEVSTSKFDVEQRGKKSYKQFEFIEFYEGMILALDKLESEGVSVELKVIDVSENTAAAVESAFERYNVAECDVLVALLLRDAFNRAAQLAQKDGIFIVNPMATRSDLCAENPYIVKIQPSQKGQIQLMLRNMKAERPNGHLYVIHSGSPTEKSTLDELRRQLDERGDIKYTLFNWSQNAKLAATLKATPNCSVISIYEQKPDQMRIFVSGLLNKLTAFKHNTPTLYTLNDWTRDYNDVDFAQLQLLNYHTYSITWDMTNQTHTDFLEAYRKRFATEPVTQLASIGHDLTIYIVGGLAHKGEGLWNEPAINPTGLLQPLHLVRNGAGLENDRAQLYRMQNLHFVPASLK